MYLKMAEVRFYQARNTSVLESTVHNVALVIRCKSTVILSAMLEEHHFKKGEI